MRDAHVHLEATLRLALGGAAEPTSPLERVLLDCARDLAVAGAGEALVRYNPIAWARRGVALERQPDDLRAAASRARGELGVEVGVWVSLKREARARELGAAVEFAVGARDHGVRGVDVSRSYDVGAAGSRPGRASPPRALASALTRARDRGLDVAVHCGWHDAPADLVEALRLGATRIGHATPLAQRPRLAAVLAAEGVTVEVCPSAFERRTGELLCSLPLAHWRDAGLRLEVGSDHPLALGTDIAREHRKLRAALPGWAPAPACVGEAA